MRTFKGKIIGIITLLFSVFTALGPVNPLNLSQYQGNYSMEVQSSPFTLVFQGLFIIVLLFHKNIWPAMRNVLFVLITFASIFIISTIFNASDMADLSSEYSTMIKLIGCIILVYKLPSFFAKYPRLMYLSMIAFSICCAIIGMLFIGGYLTGFSSIHQGRIFIFNENPNSTSARAVLSILFIMYLLNNKWIENNTKKIILTLCIIPLIAVVLAGASRGSFIIMCVCVCMYLWLAQGNSGTKRIAIVITFLTLAIILFEVIITYNPDYNVLTRLLDAYEKGDDAGRGKLIEYASQIFELNPFFGVGASLFTESMSHLFGETRTVHNVYWYILATTGIAGALLYFLFLWKIIKPSLSVIKVQPICFTLVLMMLLIGYKTGGALTYIPMWFSYGLSLYLSYSSLNTKKK